MNERKDDLLTLSEPMRAITVYQPWATLLATGAKKFETRSRKLNYRGPIAIHAAAKPARTALRGIKDELGFDTKDLAKFFEALQESIQCDPDELPHGAIVAVAELVDCHFIYASGGSRYIYRPQRVTNYIMGNEWLFGDWHPRRYALEFANMTMLPEPIPAKGNQGLWTWMPPKQNAYHN